MTIPPQEPDPLSIDREAMRAIGHRVVDMLVDRIDRLGDERPFLPTHREEMETRLREPRPTPTTIDVILRQLETDVLPFGARWDHPRFFAYIPGSGTWPSALGDFISSALNLDAALWRESPGATMLELAVIDWFKQWLGLQPGWAGLLVSGGSAANMTALACARQTLGAGPDDRHVVYVSRESHDSLAKAARVLGFHPDRIRVLPVDEGLRMRPDSLRSAIDVDRRHRRRPLFVAATAGSTRTGSVDDLRRLGAIASRNGLWFHVDAAYGGFAALTDRGRRILDGLRSADSITLDPHKWLYQPVECGCLLVRDGSRLWSAFRTDADYLADTRGSRRELNLSDYGLQLTRGARALKLWMSLRYFGVDAFRAAIDHAMDLARHAEAYILASPTLELVTPAWLSVVTFRRHVETNDASTEDEVNARLIRRLSDSGEGVISSTRVRGRRVMRLCILNHTSRSSDVERVLRWLESTEIERVPNASG